MITANFQIEKVPFESNKVGLLPHQQEQYQIITAQSRRGGLVVLEGEPGTGKTSVRKYIEANAKNDTVISVKRTLHTYTNVVKIICETLGVEAKGQAVKCERLIINKVHELKQQHQALIVIIDDAQLLEIKTLRKLRLFFDEFQENHLLLLIGQPKLLAMLRLHDNRDLCSRITHSATLRRLTSEDIRKFILREFDRCGLAHNVFQDGALELVCRSADGVLRLAKNLCRSCLFEASRLKQQIISTNIVNAVLLQPHWQTAIDCE